MVVIKAHGQIGYIRIFKNCYATCETKEEGEKFDLRITEPFEELQAIVDTYDIDSLEKPEHKLVPFIVILIKELQKFMAAVQIFKLIFFFSMMEIDLKIGMKKLSSESRLKLLLPMGLLKKKISKRLIKRLETLF